MNKQREIIYGERRKILEGTDTRSNFVEMVEHVVAAEVPTFCEGRHRETWDFEGLWDRMHRWRRRCRRFPKSMWTASATPSRTLRNAQRRVDRPV